MKKLLCAVVFFMFCVVSAFYINSNQVTFFALPTSYVAPLPAPLIHAYYNPSQTIEFWMPHIDQVFASEKKLDVSAESALSYDLTSGQLLYSKNIHIRLPIASLTKIMTAVVALENSDSSKVITITPQAAQIGEDSMGLTTGEKLTLDQLLYGLFLHSGNDAAEAIAAGSKFGRDTFVYQMNKKAEDLGLLDTHFTNPTGLEGDGRQYSTAFDLLVFTRYGLQNPEFAQVAATINQNIPATATHKSYDLFNETNLLTTYPGVKGVKTGFTNEAGFCLVTYLDYGGHKIIGIILNSENRRQDMKDILDFSLKALGVTPPQHG